MLMCRQIDIQQYISMKLHRKLWRFHSRKYDLNVCTIAIILYRPRCVEVVCLERIFRWLIVQDSSIFIANALEILQSCTKPSIYGISDCDDAYTWGWNESGQLGLPCKTLEESRQNESETTDVTDTKQADDEDRKPVNLQLIPQVLEVTRDGEVVDFRSASCGSRHTTLLDGMPIVFVILVAIIGNIIQEPYHTVEIGVIHLKIGFRSFHHLN